jgi:uncharacterized membrane protein SirB2
MFYSFDAQMGQIHVLLAWASVALFLVRGLAFQLGAGWAMDTRLQTLVFGIDLLLTITGLSLWGLLYLNPLRDAWLGAKFLALVAYTVFAHAAMGKGEFSVLSYAAALLMLAYMMAASITRSAMLGLV